MPLWVPVIKNFIGQSLINQPSTSNVIPSSLTNVLQTVGLSLPNLNSQQNLTQVLWMTFEAQALDENSIGVDTT